MTTRLITEPTSEPVTLAEAKLHLRVDTIDDDARITELITSARQQAELILKRSLLPQTWEKTLDAFPSSDIELLYPSVIAIESIKYQDLNNNQITLSAANYYLDKDSEPAWAILAYGYTWPATLGVANAVRVRYSAGYANTAAVPASIKQWIKLAVEKLYDTCKDDVPDGFAMALLDRYIVWG